MFDDGQTSSGDLLPDEAIEEQRVVDRGHAMPDAVRPEDVERLR